jgi:undecaprenyl-diphosphatase
MNLLEAIFLGIIQGVTEFLPISSDGHLVLLPNLLRMSEPDLNLIAITHQGTLLAVLVYFRRDLWYIARAFVAALQQRQPLGTVEARLGWYILAGSLPAGVVGLVFKDFFQAVFSSPVAAGFFLLVTAAFLVAGERWLSGWKQLDKMGWLDAVIIGCAQVLALLPGLSRSGSTIAAGLWRGMDRSSAARFSFLLGIPAIFGAGLLAMVDVLNANVPASQWPIFAAATLAAAVTGYLCITFLLNWLRRHSLYIFALYCALFGLLSLVIFLLGR